MRALCSIATLSLLLLLAGSAEAIPVQLTIVQGGDGGFNFSWIHEAATACGDISVSGSDVEFCKNGPKDRVSGTLSADLTGLVLSGIMGTIVVDGGPDVDVTDGTIDFGSSAPDTFGAFLETSTHGTFYFLDHIFAGAAHSFDGSAASLWGNNWNSGSPGNPPGGVRWGIDLRLVVEAPEPSAAILVLAGAAALLLAVPRPNAPARVRVRDSRSRARPRRR